MNENGKCDKGNFYEIQAEKILVNYFESSDVETTTDHYWFELYVRTSIIDHFSFYVSRLCRNS